MNPKHRRIWRYIKPLLDLLLIILAFGIAYLLRYQAQWIRQVEPAYLVPFQVYIPSMLGLTGITLLTYWIEGAYRQERDRHFLAEFSVVLRGGLTGIAATIFIVFLSSPSYYSRLIFAYTGVAIVVLIGISRGVERAVFVNQHRRGIGVSRVVLIGAGEMAHSIIRTIYARPELGYQLIGFLDDDPARSQTDIGRFTALGTTDQLPRILKEQRVDEVIIALPWGAHRKIVNIIDLCEKRHVTVHIIPDLYQLTLSRVAMENLNGIPLLSLHEPALRDWQILLKRALDVVLSILVLVILSPVILITVIAIIIDSKGPIIFSQERVGKDNRTFKLYKFRSMYVGAEEQVEVLVNHNEASGPLFKIRNDPRCTNVGKFIRRASIDELPQFWNVLKGDMSVIGPRPALRSEVDKYEPWHLRRLEVSPGITGLWQVSGRSDLTFDEMVLLDVYYIENWSPTLDLGILLKTIPTVVMGSGAY
jgi:exopolysaccharide biosynthesis polyprenyl glycosylphosphotransferase